MNVLPDPLVKHYVANALQFDISKVNAINTKCGSVL